VEWVGREGRKGRVFVLFEGENERGSVSQRKQREGKKLKESRTS